jgi:hypothetical protein
VLKDLLTRGIYVIREDGFKELLRRGIRYFLRPLFRCFVKDKQIIYPIVGDSHALSTLNKIKRLLEGRKIDFLFIDACHDYGSVKKDYEFYSPLVGEGGIVAFHDINSLKSSGWASGVHKLWNEIKGNYRNLEIINDPKREGYGIGLLFKGKPQIT